MNNDSLRYTTPRTSNYEGENLFGYDNRDLTGNELHQILTGRLDPLGESKKCSCYVTNMILGPGSLSVFE